MPQRRVPISAPSPGRHGLGTLPPTGEPLTAGAAEDWHYDGTAFGSAFHQVMEHRPVPPLAAQIAAEAARAGLLGVSRCQRAHRAGAKPWSTLLLRVRSAGRLFKELPFSIALTPSWRASSTSSSRREGTWSSLTTRPTRGRKSWSGAGTLPLPGLRLCRRHGRDHRPSRERGLLHLCPEGPGKKLLQPRSCLATPHAARKHKPGEMRIYYGRNEASRTLGHPGAPALLWPKVPASSWWARKILAVVKRVLLHYNGLKQRIC